MKPLHKKPLRQLLTGLLVVFSCLSLALMANPLEGAYTINATEPTGGTNYASFSDFAADINLNGVSGPVMVSVVAGTGPYAEQVVIGPVPGLGPDAPLMIDGNGETMTALTSSTDRHVLRLKDVSYVTVSNLKVVWDSESSGGFYGIHLLGSASHVQITGCEIDISGTTSTLYGGIVASGSETSILTTGDFHDVSIVGNTSTGGGYGASVFGLLSDLASNIVIANNQFYDFHSNGVYLRETDGAVVRGNVFDKSTANVSSCNAIQVAQNANVNAEIFNNRIRVSQMMNGTQTFRGIYLFNGTGHRVYNNVIFGVNLVSGNVIGIEVRTAGTAPEIYFNTISIDNPEASTGNLYGFVEGLSNTNTILRNNLISIGQPGTGNRSALVLGATSVLGTALDSDHNLLYVPGGNVAQRGTFSPTFYPSMSSWQVASGQDMNSLDLPADFVGFLEPVPTNPDAEDAGIPIPWILFDIEGNPRGDTPDVGAFEFGDCDPPDAPAEIGGLPAVCVGAVHSFQVEAELGFVYNWTLTGNATLLEGQGTGEIIVQFEDSDVFISVTAETNCGLSEPTGWLVQVMILPMLSIAFDEPVCVEDGLILLEGTAMGLTISYTGPGVDGLEFDPGLAGVGTHEIMYVYTNVASGCFDTGMFMITVEVCTGIEELAGGGKLLRAYPNPMEEMLFIENPREGATVELRVFNAFGQLVQRAEQAGALLEWRRGALPSGVYWLQLFDGVEHLGTLKAVAK